MVTNRFPLYSFHCLFAYLSSCVREGKYSELVGHPKWDWLTARRCGRLVWSSSKLCCCFRFVLLVSFLSVLCYRQNYLYSMNCTVALPYPPVLVLVNGLDKARKYIHTGIYEYGWALDGNPSRLLLVERHRIRVKIRSGECASVSNTFPALVCTCARVQATPRHGLGGAQKPYAYIRGGVVRQRGDVGALWV